MSLPVENRTKCDRKVLQKQILSAEEAVKIAEPVIRKLSSSRKIPGMDYEDIVQSLYVAMLEALPKFDSTRAAFLTFTWSVAQNELNRLWRFNKTEKRGSGAKTISLDEPVYGDEAGEGKLLLEGILAGESMDNLYREKEIRTCITDSVQSINDLTIRQMVILYLEGYIQIEIANLCDCSQANVSVQLRNFKKNLRERLKKLDY